MEDPNLSVPIASSSSGGDGGAHGSHQNKGLLGSSGGDAGSGNGGGDAEFGFRRPDFGRGTLAGTVQIYDRHVFLRYEDPPAWPPRVEAAEFDRLPRLLSAAVAARKPDMKKRTRVTLCEGEDGTESSNGDVLIFPDMIRYRSLTHFDVDNFVEEVLVKDTEWLPGTSEKLTGSYVFVCSHGSRDQRCGACGPLVIKKFKEEIQDRGLQGQVSVSACSHIGGHKYAGNAIIFSPNVVGEVTGHWYGYISPDDVPLLLEQHIGKGEVVTHLWRGQMGLTEEEQKKAQDLRCQLNDETEREKSAKECDRVSKTTTGAAGCCQVVGNPTCCQNPSPEGKLGSEHRGEHKIKKTVEDSSCEGSKGSGRKGSGSKGGREDTYSALSVAAAVVSVVIAYGCYRKMRERKRELRQRRWPVVEEERERDGARKGDSMAPNEVSRGSNEGEGAKQGRGFLGCLGFREDVGKEVGGESLRVPTSMMLLPSLPPPAARVPPLSLSLSLSNSLSFSLKWGRFSGGELF